MKSAATKEVSYARGKIKVSYIAGFLPKLSRKSRQMLSLVTKRLGPFVRLLGDGSGRVVYKGDGEVSKSTLPDLLRYFFRFQYSGPDKNLRPNIPKPVDASRFLILLRRLRIPAKHFRMIPVSTLSY